MIDLEKVIIHPELNSWIFVPDGSDFPIQNIPFGVFKTKNSEPRCGCRIGDTIIDLSVLAENGFFSTLEGFDASVFFEDNLNAFISQKQKIWRMVRKRIAELFSVENGDISKDENLKSYLLFPLEKVEMCLPLRIGDYTDFYSSIEHATNVGKMFRDPENALLPNWKHLPVGYHGRSSSICVSGTNFHRPWGQTFSDAEKNVVFHPAKALDFELEMAFVTDDANLLGESVSTDDAENHIFGLMIFNDLSARDIQKWEYVPLGPFLAKNFGSVISPWIVTLDALEPFRVDGPVQHPEVLSYLQFSGKRNIDMHLEVYLKPEKGGDNLISSSNFKYMYWNMAQQLAHHTINGCNLKSGDILASGTISGPDENSFGSMLELTWNGSKPLTLKDGKLRKFLEDGDTICMKAYCKNDALRIGFGDCITTILKAKERKY